MSLDGTGAELKYVRGGDGQVLITDVQEMLDKIEDRVSRVLGVPGAPDSLDDPRVLELLITLAGIGTELDTFLEPLAIGDARSINVTINPMTKVFPLELVYTGPPPDAHASLCDHVTNPPPPGQGCDKASTKRGLSVRVLGAAPLDLARTVKSHRHQAAAVVEHRLRIVRVVRGDGDRRQGRARAGPVQQVLTAAAAVVRTGRRRWGTGATGARP